MDYPEALVALAHMKLRLERLTRNPSLIEEYPHMAIPNFQGLGQAMDLLEHSLETEAVKLHGEITSIGNRGLAAIGKGREKVNTIKARVAEVESFVSKLEGSNGSPLDSSASGSAPVTPAPPAAAPEPGPNGGPRILNSNGAT